MYVPCLPDEEKQTCLGNYTLEDLQEYLVAPNFYIVRNEQRIDTMEFDNHPIIEESTVQSISFDTTYPSLIQGTVRLQTLED